MLGEMGHHECSRQQRVLGVSWIILLFTSAYKSPVGTHIPVDISRAAGKHAFIQLPRKHQLLIPVWQAIDVVGHRVLRHPHFLSILGSQFGGTLHVAQWWVTIEVTRDDIDLLTGNRVIQQHIRIRRVETQRLGTDEANAWVFLPVEFRSMVLHQFQLLLWSVETTGVVDPPVRLVLNRYRIHLHTVGFHVGQEGVEPWKELLIAVFAQLSTLVALVVAIATLGGSVGLVGPWW